MEFKLPTGSIISIVSTGLWGVGIILVLCVLGFFIYRHYKNKVSFKDNVTLTWVFDNGMEKTLFGLKGGKYIGKQGAYEYQIKIPKQIKKKDLGYLPDFSKADADGSLHFVTCGDGTFWQQCEWKTLSKENRDTIDEQGNKVEFYEFQLLKKPIIGSDEKNIMIKDIKNWRDVVAKNKLMQYAIGIGAFIIMVIAHLISLYVQTKVKCPSIP